VEHLELSGTADMGVNALLASLFEAGVESLRLAEFPASFRQGPDYLNILQVLDLPQATELARRRGIEVLTSVAE
jgi:hypothetical protein